MIPSLESKMIQAGFHQLSGFSNEARNTHSINELGSWSRHMALLSAWKHWHLSQMAVRGQRKNFCI